jgi:hypothetical protein
MEECPRCARGLQDDLTAVTAGLIVAWSTGVTEGQVHRLKLLKHQGYGLGRVRPLTAAHPPSGLGRECGSPAVTMTEDVLTRFDL